MFKVVNGIQKQSTKWQQKIISGMEDGTFGLGQDVTRAQVATFMVKAKDIKTGSTNTPFTDVNEKTGLLHTFQLLKLTKLWLV